VTPACLIPRSDTEILVDEVIKRLPEGARFIDLCTGSGCIALSTLNNTDSTRAVALDISKAALAVARENAERISEVIARRAETAALQDALAQEKAARAADAKNRDEYEGVLMSMLAEVGYGEK
jgi:methylase of polypeptide subunit release factors